jgi:hypothetical protein
MMVFIELSQVLTTNNYNILKITVNTAHKIRSSNHTLSPHMLTSTSSSTILLTFLNSQLQFFQSILWSKLVRVRVRFTVWLVVYRQSVCLGVEPLEIHGQTFLPQMNTYNKSPYIISSLTRGWVCHIQLLLDLASAFILGSECSPRFETSLFVASCDSQGYGGGIRTRLHTGMIQSSYNRPSI